MHKLTVIAILMMSAAAYGQGACTTLYHHGDRDVVLCHVADTYTRAYLTSTNAAQETISRDLYLKLMSEDAADLQAHTAQLKAVQEQSEKDQAAAEAHHAAVMAALKITSKKQCKASGFDWQHGICVAPEAK